MSRDMENNYQGDLGDIVRGSRGTNVIYRDTTTTTMATNDLFGSSSKAIQEHHTRNSDAYSFPEVTLLRDIDAISMSTTFLNNTGADDSTNGGGGELCSGGGLVQVMGPGSASAPNSNNLCNIYSSNMIQISQDKYTSNNTDSNSNSNDVNLPMLPAAEASQLHKVVKAKAAGFGFMSNQMISINASCSSSPKVGGFDNSTNDTGAQMQIPSPRNQGIKRRKIQAKKVVCIPAPAAAPSRQTGEVVPSDLWAWRKYGQKPIKGSPYPRGYYRCSSSKGCSARKQVERSRTDPNMLVITYTSEHNHPWPTQRNALAGSARSYQPSSKTSSKASQPSQTPSDDNFRNVLIKEENPSVAANTASTSTVKEEELGLNDDRYDINKVEEIIESYRPLILPEPKISRHGQQDDQDVFADLVDEFASDEPLELLNSRGCKGFDYLSGLLDWATNSNTTPINEENHNDLSHQEKLER